MQLLLKRRAMLAAMVLAGLPAAAVETITVVEKRSTGQMYHELHRQISMDDYCASINHSQPWCPQYQGGVGGPGMPNYGGNQPCSDTENVSADCRCTGNTPQKVYDADTGMFYCRSAPPDGPCPLWGRDFDHDPGVWGCVDMPLPDDVKQAARKIKNCLWGTSPVNQYWDRIDMSYGALDAGKPGRTSCDSSSTRPSITLDRGQMGGRRTPVGRFLLKP